MLKTHKITGLKYLCKTSTRNPFTYLGSGKYWKRHIKKHGTQIHTSILEECLTRAELVMWGTFYSKLWNVVNSEDFANLVEERGDGGPTMLGRRITPKQAEKKQIALRSWWKKATKEQRESRRAKNKKCHETAIHTTPLGVFNSASEAAKVHKCCVSTITFRCVHNSNTPIKARKFFKFGWRGKTWKELGWSSTPLALDPK